jgi:hypothetical protein
MFTYRLLWADGSDAGDATYSADVQPGEIIHSVEAGKVVRLRVLDLVQPPKEGSGYAGLLLVSEEP